MSTPSTTQFATISLEELAERASLLTRVDRKYVVPASDLVALLAELESQARVLEIDGRQHFDYESVYFDTPEAASYLLAAHPRRRRFKARTRSYLDTGDCYLEVKTKGSRGTTAKQRLPYSFDERNSLTAEGREYIDELLHDASVGGIDTGSMEPVLTTRYTRTTLFLPGSGSRCTIDSELAWECDADMLQFNDTVIVETKSSGQASEVDRLLWRMGHRPDRISKFATGLAALRPELPRNRWSRVLRRHFMPALDSVAA
ncbi:polyphosphate polymerase domain-containing protein [Salinibacterium sp. SWN1162]|uniref:polyphosphate polymerase domain-containing protein n=1 Tax=Salinibacterium sp. SWN1162 TaxID=2792053 RepID=UPI0018CF0F20|nr:polyphosphate polymerase domain-containing protein [Salinibacterium sp. SWN1162]MBH0009903.1 polyphosphate polymerase domain-containing protein [Salinibacterium sp. SWN1162]